MRHRLHIVIRGAVQGVGFRPFIYRLATELGLLGWVLNSTQGVFIDVEGMKENLDDFLLRIETEKPPRAFIQSLEFSFLDPVGFTSFEIRRSDNSGETSALVLPDIATCSECLSEIFDPANRRYLYPFTNCTNCGPRFTIIESLPYDRPKTTMKLFEMCPECRQEYQDPLNRRFHAQPNACPVCGPHVEVWDYRGKVLEENHAAVEYAAQVVCKGEILAVKGIGGFHLMVDARNDDAVVRLRQRKLREEKPFALMFPLLKMVKAECEVSDMEERLLLSPESPIVLLQSKNHNPKSVIRNPKASIAPSVSPNNPCFGVMLPYAPLHHILMRELGFPVVATSGNLSDEPICTDEHEALERLKDISDVFLVHDRPIVRHVDDSVVRVMMGRELVMRRARGYAPLPINVRGTSLHTSPVLAVGAHLKNTVALNANGNVFISQHIGDLETKEAFDAFQKVIGDLQNLYDKQVSKIVCDLHPDYLSTKYASELGVPVMSIQHHYAHVTSCMAENQLEGEVLGISWDGTGYGLDGSIWGGEFLLTNENSFDRVASLRTFRLPGGEIAIKEPRRAAVGLLYELFGKSIFERDDLLPIQSFTLAERRLLQQMLERGIYSPLTSSVGRLFDVVASIVGLRQWVNFEGQAAMELEFVLAGEETNEIFGFQISDYRLDSNTSTAGQNHFGIRNPKSVISIDWEPMLLEVLTDVGHGFAASLISAKFHNTLAEIIVEVSKKIGVERVVLTGGCFQNKYLTELTVARLRHEGFRPYWHQRVPPNDGGIAFGQIYAAVRATNLVNKRRNSILNSHDSAMQKPLANANRQVTEEALR